MTPPGGMDLVFDARRVKTDRDQFEAKSHNFNGSFFYGSSLCRIKRANPLRSSQAALFERLSPRPGKPSGGTQILFGNLLRYVDVRIDSS